MYKKIFRRLIFCFWLARTIRWGCIKRDLFSFHIISLALKFGSSNKCEKIVCNSQCVCFFLLCVLVLLLVTCYLLQLFNVLVF